MCHFLGDNNAAWRIAAQTKNEHLLFARTGVRFNSISWVGDYRERPGLPIPLGIPNIRLVAS